MSFVDPLFIFFVAVVFPIHHVLRRSFSSPWPFLLFLLAASSFFYGLLYPPHLLLLFLSSLVAWGGARILPRGSVSRGRLYAAGTVLILIPLAYFKYYNFLIDSFAWTGFHPPKSDFILPLGISFFTFQNISYLTDVWRGTVSAERNFIRYLCYITFFPHVQAGPIMTAREFLPQLYVKQPISREDLGEGMFYLLGGYLKKAVLADRLALVADPAFANPEMYNGIGLIVAAAAYTLQIYFDFSGYSDIAIGLGRLLGYKIPENFLFPYSASSVREFWRRWHITLSSWLRDHIYIPLGGSRHGASRTAAALFMTMLLGGLWHGAHWNFVIWGGAHGLLLGVERLWNRAWAGRSVLRQGSWAHRSLRLVSTAVTFVVVGLLWVFFRTGSYPDGLSRAVLIYRKIFELSPVGIESEAGARGVLWAGILLVLAGFAFQTIRRWFVSAPLAVVGGASGFAILGIVILSPGASTFIYFVF